MKLTRLDYLKIKLWFFEDHIERCPDVVKPQIKILQKEINKLENKFEK